MNNSNEQKKIIFFIHYFIFLETELRCKYVHVEVNAGWKSK